MINVRRFFTTLTTCTLNYCRQRLTWPLALILGLTWPLAFPPHRAWYLAIINLVALSFLLELSDTHGHRSSTFLIWTMTSLAGLYGGLSYSVHHYGGAPWSITVILLILAAFLVALCPLFFSRLLDRLKQKLNTPLLFAALLTPLIWVLTEKVLSIILQGEWISASYSQLDSPLANWATLIGSYGLSFLTVQSGQLIKYCLAKWRVKSPLATKTSVNCLIYFMVLWLVPHLTPFKPRSVTSQYPLYSHLIQLALTPDQKWQNYGDSGLFKRYLEISELATNQLPKSEGEGETLLVWPEAAVPTLADMLESDHQNWQEDLAKEQITLVTGTMYRNKPRQETHNSLMVFSLSAGRYDKRQLLMFGEYVPLKRLLAPLLTWLPFGDLDPGHKAPLLPLAHHQAVVAICSELTRAAPLAIDWPHSDLIIAVGDDGWFGPTQIGYFHLAVARMRSLELGLPQLWLNNYGPSAWINATGKLQRFAKQGEPAIISFGWRPERRLTAYGRLLYLFNRKLGVNRSPEP